MKILTLLLFIPFLSFAQEDEQVVYDFAEVDPQYPGGPEAMTKFIVDHITYPAKSKEKGEQGVVYVKFVVSKTGELREIRVVKGVSPLLDAEAVRVISIMPNWIPGMKDGKPVNAYFLLPINFRLG